MGRSLGIDLVPLKTCSYDCLFCQVGQTRMLTLERAEWVPLRDVLAEFQSWLNRGEAADWLTLAGSGEPTLHSGFGDLIDALHGLCKIPVALLSNGSLFHLPDVRRAAGRADLVKVSLSAWDDASFRRVNRAPPRLRFNEVVEGLQQFGCDFRGELWLEVFLMAGINDDEEAVRKIAALADGMGPRHIHLNTVARPPADEGARPVPRVVLDHLAGLFHPRAEVIASPVMTDEPAVGGDWDDAHLLAMLARHACTSEDLSRAAGRHAPDVLRRVTALVAARQVREEVRDGEVYYVSASVEG
jgi:wyosine [tRNA(Phe)-imidazoG37] synthetase (radical SAM superfamily)